MYTKLFSLCAGIALLSACSGNKASTETTVENVEETATENVDIKGQWYLENIVVNDSVSVRPAEEAPDVRQYITFDDSTYFIQTNCNTFSGAYTINGDSITLGDDAMTEMACENMATEDILRSVLPHIALVNVENDSIVRLNSATSSEYIVLRKATEQK